MGSGGAKELDREVEKNITREYMSIYYVKDFSMHCLTKMVSFIINSTLQMRKQMERG